MLPNFKTGINPESWKYLHPNIRQVFDFCEIMFDNMGYDCLITSTVRPKGDDTGIHATGRALDFVINKRETTKRILTNNENHTFAATLSLIFKPMHGLPVCLYHTVGLGYHFHLQVSPTAGWTDLDGKLPDGSSEKPLAISSQEAQTTV